MGMFFREKWRGLFVKHSRRLNLGRQVPRCLHSHKGRVLPHPSFGWKVPRLPGPWAPPTTRQPPGGGTCKHLALTNLSTTFEHLWSSNAKTNPRRVFIEDT